MVNNLDPRKGRGIEVQDRGILFLGFQGKIFLSKNVKIILKNLPIFLQNLEIFIKKMDNFWGL